MVQELELSSKKCRVSGKYHYIRCECQVRGGAWKEKKQAERRYVKGNKVLLRYIFITSAPETW